MTHIGRRESFEVRQLNAYSVSGSSPPSEKEARIRAGACHQSGGWWNPCSYSERCEGRSG